MRLVDASGADRGGRYQTMWRMLVVATMALAANAVGHGAERPAALDLESDPAQVAQLLAKLDVWMLPQPKTAAATGGAFDLARCKGIRLTGEAGSLDSLAKDFPAPLHVRSGVTLGVTPSGTPTAALRWGFSQRSTVAGVVLDAASEFRGLGSQGYVVHIDSAGVAAAATAAEGLFYASQTLAQIATTRAPAGHAHSRLAVAGVSGSAIRCQPGAGADGRGARAARRRDRRGQGQYARTLHRGRIPVEKPSRHTAARGDHAQEARELFDHAASRQVEVHPAFQGFGHWDKILAKPAYRPLGVSGSTIDVRKPATVALVREMVDELCHVFPGKFFNVDITENDAAA